MLLPLRVCLRMIVPVLGCVALLGYAASVHADPKPLSKEEQAKVDKAIEKGVEFLKQSQGKNGDWPVSMRGNYRLGQNLLVAYALLESGMPVAAPTIQTAADYIRPRLLKVDQTYEVSLGVLFLDRLGNPKDKPMIRSLALRLIAGQHVTGGWNYRCPLLSKEQEKALLKALAELNEGLESSEKSRVELVKGLELPRTLRALAVFRDPRKLPWRDAPPSEANEMRVQFVGATDNSNTQFAMLGLWAAQRHDAPVGPTFRLTVERFARSQLPNGWWSYALLDKQSQRTFKQPSMLCVGLIGLAIGQGLKLPTPGASQRAGPDLALIQGVAALSQDLDVAVSGTEEHRSCRGLYYLWSVSRVAMLLDLPTIGAKDWYRWGVSLLLDKQMRDGSWNEVLITEKDTGHGLNGAIGTSFALLFLKCSHPMKDLTPKLPVKGKDLNQRVARVLMGDAPLGSSTIAPSRSEKPKH